jgi:hypothetical protein
VPQAAAGTRRGPALPRGLSPPSHHGQRPWNRRAVGSSHVQEP